MEPWEKWLIPLHILIPLSLRVPYDHFSISHFVLYLPFVSLKPNSYHPAAPERSDGVGFFPEVGMLWTQAPAQGLVLMLERGLYLSEQAASEEFGFTFTFLFFLTMNIFVCLFGS